MPTTNELRRFTVGQGTASYSVEIGSGLLGMLSFPELVTELTHKAPVVLIYPCDLPLPFVELVQQRLSPVLSLEVPARDECKTIAVYQQILGEMASMNLPRTSAVIGLGGGAVTDLAGFVAATYLRGVAFYAIPTTLLGMVDAAIGGKTALNLPQGKNLVGAFYTPRAVICDTDTLATLPPTVFREGAAEAYKHGLIAKAKLLDQVLSPTFQPGTAEFVKTLAEAIQVKAHIVTRDFTEQNDRAFLNFGHTLAHALEAVTMRTLPHGHAVGYGMHYAALLSRAMGHKDCTRYTWPFLEWQQPNPLPPLMFEEVMSYMARDKKADMRGVRFVLLREVGEPYLRHVTHKVLQEQFEVWQDDVATFRGL